MTAAFVPPFEFWGYGSESQKLLRDWFDPRLWKINNSFWPEMNAAYNPNYAITKPASRFQAYIDRLAHEMAHFIECADNEVLDPSWGSTTWTFNEHFNTIEDIDKEIRVFTIEMLIAGGDPYTCAGQQLEPYFATHMMEHPSIRPFDKFTWYCRYKAGQEIARWESLGSDTIVSIKKEMLRKTQLALNLLALERLGHVVGELSAERKHQTP